MEGLTTQPQSKSRSSLSLCPVWADRSKETIQLYTLERLYVADGDKAADRVAYRDRTYRLVRVEDYDQQGEVWIALAQLEEPAS